MLNVYLLFIIQNEAEADTVLEVFLYRPPKGRKRLYIVRYVERCREKWPGADPKGEQAHREQGTKQQECRMYLSTSTFVLSWNQMVVNLKAVVAQEYFEDLQVLLSQIQLQRVLMARHNFLYSPGTLKSVLLKYRTEHFTWWYN